MLIINADAHDRHAVVEHPHKERTDNRTHNCANAAGHRCATDKHRRNHIKFKSKARFWCGGIQTRRKHKARSRRQNSHVYKREKGEALGIDARQFRRFLIAAHRVDTTANYGVFSEKGVDYG